MNAVSVEINKVYYVDCVNACRADPDNAERLDGTWVLCPECFEPGIVYDLREGEDAE